MPLTDPLVGVCDVGGTQLRVALADRAGNLIARRAMPHVTRDARAVIDRIANQLSALAQQYEVALQGIGASVPGPLDAARGVVLFSPNLDWREVAFSDELSVQMKLPVALDDDANCAALGEQWRGVGGNVSSHHNLGLTGVESTPSPDESTSVRVLALSPTPRDDALGTARDLVYIIVGTGIGSGLILNGKLYRGATGGAGEIGHTTIEPDGPRCSCGNRGCLEVLAAGPALLRRAHEMGLTHLSTAEVIDGARRGDLRAQQVIQEAGRYLGIGLANVVNMLNPEVIVFGGGVALDARELLLVPAREEMQARALATLAAQVRLELAWLGDDAGLVGAARLIWEKVNSERWTVEGEQSRVDSGG